MIAMRTYCNHHPKDRADRRQLQQLAKQRRTLIERRREAQERRQQRKIAKTA